ncbi:uncharacterized protein BX663DRAFT_529647 [Cokeromyces recurvatus]|uniref:uncharacterized protein n=1 Tax=Cokeromyces recurvatus TaxID=90255 RepID=UPI00221F1BF6|nr:uncharacterized protein BX663DRAFT_529647 [Cokeromyces recurvatus]KAI7905407.1 hypothetical protein BX663DRAFT_529647 [Cokeromyces recurvatus]
MISKQWSLYDLQYVVLTTILLIDFTLIQSPTFIPRLCIGSLLFISFWIPYIRRFTLPALPIFTWLITFYACQFIPIHYRPTHIFVNLLPTLERILYGANLSEIISKHTHPILDILTWIPYGLIHFSFPFILSILIFIFGPPGSLKTFGKAFGYMNLAGVLTQLYFPNASPWYEIIYGSAPANYSIPGEAGGLIRIDKILGLSLYGSSFGTSPLVFGAFPSLHSGCATIEMLFVSYLFPRLKPICFIYVMWMWFSTMYLTHHYMIDLVGGSIYAILTFTIAYPFLPKRIPHYRTRMDYFGVSKSNIRTFIYSIEHEDLNNDSSDINDEESALKEIHQTTATTRSFKRPESLKLYTINEKRILEEEEEEENERLPGLSPSSSSHWSFTSEPSSPITPYSSSPRMQLNKL